MGGKIKRLTKVVHPNSRKALEIAAKQHHMNKTTRVANHTKQKNSVLSKKLQWFQEAIAPVQADEEKMSYGDEENQDETQEENQDELAHLRGKSLYTRDELHALVEIYFKRFEDETDQIKTKNAIGKRHIGQHTSRLQAIQITISSEKDEYNTVGIAVPDLMTLENVINFRNWNGELSTIQSVRLFMLKSCTLKQKSK